MAEIALRLAAETCTANSRRTALQQAASRKIGIQWVRRLFTELRQRKVGRVATAYVLTAWLGVQFADVLLPLIGAPKRIMELLVVLAAGGLPVAVVLSWIFELTPRGLVPDDRDLEKGDAAIINSILLIVSTAIACVLAYLFVEAHRGLDEPLAAALGCIGG